MIQAKNLKSRDSCVYDIGIQNGLGCVLSLPSPQFLSELVQGPQHIFVE